MKFALEFTPQPNAPYKSDYSGLVTQYNTYVLYNQPDKIATDARQRCKDDLFFLLYFVLGVKTINHPWVVERIREVEELHDRTLDLWSREHFKSTILTYGLVIQDLLNNPEERIAIFSHTGAIAKSFLHRIKLTFESNDLLKLLFPDVLYTDPKGQSPKWSVDDGIIVKRKGVYNEASIEAYGFVDSMPTSKHYTIRVYDDIVTDKSVTTPEQIKKTDQAWKLSQFLRARGGTVRVVGTRYHFADQYAKLKESGMWEIRERRGVVDGKSLVLTQEELDDFKKVVCFGNTYTYNCLPANTKIIMADFSLKDIQDILVGDIVLGVFQGTLEKKGGFCPTRVLATNKRTELVVQYNLSNGESLQCTLQHKWWTGRWTPGTGKRYVKGEGFRALYLPLWPDKNAKGHTSAVVKALNINWAELSEEQWKCALWLGGIFDGEGSVSGGLLTIGQSRIAHPEVCERIEYSLNLLNFDFGMQGRNDAKQGMVVYYLRGGRNEVFRFLNQTNPAKRKQVVDGLLYSSSRISGADKRVEVVEMEFLDEAPVFNIQTETGNYIANGYVSSNCQMLLDPVAEEAQEFKREWLRYYRQLPDRALNYYLFCDPANAKKARGSGSDYTVYWLWGLDPLGNYFLIDMIRDRLNLFERWKTLKRMVMKYPHIVKVFYEEYGMQADIQHFNSKMKDDGIYFSIEPMGGKVRKEDRIRKLIPLFEEGKVYLPEVLFRESNGTDLIKEFVEEEYCLFPYSSHDDMLDAASRVRDEGCECYPPMGFPLEGEEGDEYDNVVNIGNWSKAKANSRFANV